MDDRARFDAMWQADDVTGCWEWSGARFRHGYGVFNWLNRKTTRSAHRASWMLYRGKIPEGMLVLHRCDNRGCVNPDHLFIGTQKDNIDDMWRKGRGARKGPNGEAARTARLTDDIARLVRTDPRNGAALAREFGVTRATINKIRRGETWRHVS